MADDITQEEVRAYVFGDPARPDLRRVHVLGGVTPEKELAVREEAVRDIMAMPPAKRNYIVSARMPMVFMTDELINPKGAKLKAVGYFSQQSYKIFDLVIPEKSIRVMLDPGSHGQPYEDWILHHEFGHRKDYDANDFHSEQSAWQDAIRESIRKGYGSEVSRYLLSRGENNIVRDTDGPEQRQQIKKFQDYVNDLKRGKSALLPFSDKTLGYFKEAGIEIAAQMEADYASRVQEGKDPTAFMTHKWGNLLWQQFQADQAAFEKQSEEIVSARSQLIDEHVSLAQRQAEKSGQPFDRAEYRKEALITYSATSLSPEELKAESDPSQRKEKYIEAFQRMASRNKLAGPSTFWNWLGFGDPIKDAAAAKFSSHGNDPEKIPRAIYQLQAMPDQTADKAAADYARLRELGAKPVSIEAVLGWRYPELMPEFKDEIVRSASNRRGFETGFVNSYYTNYISAGVKLSGKLRLSDTEMGDFRRQALNFAMANLDELIVINQENFKQTSKQDFPHDVLKQLKEASKAQWELDETNKGKTFIFDEQAQRARLLQLLAKDGPVALDAELQKIYNESFVTSDYISLALKQGYSNKEISAELKTLSTIEQRREAASRLIWEIDPSTFEYVQRGSEVKNKLSADEIKRLKSFLGSSSTDADFMANDWDIDKNGQISSKDITVLLAKLKPEMAHQFNIEGRGKDDDQSFITNRELDELIQKAGLTDKINLAKPENGGDFLDKLQGLLLYIAKDPDTGKGGPKKG